MEKLTAVIYNDYGRYACTYQYMENGIVQSPNPYDTDLPVIEDAREFSYFFFFVFLFGLERGEWTSFCWLLLLLLLEFLFEMSGRLHTYVIYVKLQY